MRWLLACGIGTALFYGAMNAVVPMFWPEYRCSSQTVSELSAVGAPTRPLWLALGVIYSTLYAAFGAGVWAAAQGKRSLRVAGISILVSALLGLAWPPMHLRPVLAAGGGTLTDTLHLVWTAAWGVLSICAMLFAAAALGRGFRVFTGVCLALMLVFGALTGVEAPRVPLDAPTPWIGVWERLNMACYFVWLAAFAISLLRPTPVDPGSKRIRSAARLQLLVGVGDRITLAALPFALLGILANALWPAAFHLGLSRAGLILGGCLLAVGIPLWFSSAMLILLLVPQGRLITHGPFALMLHPLYTSVALLVAPGVGLVCDSWLGFALGLVLYVASRHFAPREERELAQRFSAEYPAYRKRVLLPWL